VDVLSAGARIGGSGAGAVVGEVAFLLGTARMNQVVAGRDGAFVLGFSSAALIDAVERDPGLGAGLYRAVATNLAHKLLERQGRAPGSPG
jgi:CRP-like cAMP-binding protein